MNKDQASGKFDRAVGKVKQGVGEAVGSDKLANEGVADQAKGAAKETWGNVKDAAEQVKQSHTEQASDKANEVRGKISRKIDNSIDNAKEKIDEKVEKFKERRSA